MNRTGRLLVVPSDPMEEGHARSGVPLPDFLAAKYELDERSLNPIVRNVFEAALRSLVSVRILDLGCGSGSTLRRILRADSTANVDITAVDRDSSLLDIARATVIEDLEKRDFDISFDISKNIGRIVAERHRQKITIQLQQADLRDFQPDQPGRYDAVIAHALMDLLPASLMAKRIYHWLAPAGLFYASLNYDGGTTLFPQYADLTLEAAIMASYDQSMDRHLNNNPCGGAQSGRRLHTALMAAGYDVLAYGSSDWNITPYFGSYRDQDRLCLAALLDMIHDEAQRSGLFQVSDIDAWYRHRLGQLQAASLGLIIHQIDMVGQKSHKASPDQAS